MKNFSVIATISISVLLFLVSLLLPAFYTRDEGIPGWFALLLGWLDLLAIDQVGFGVLSWFANLFLPVAWLGLALGKFRRVRIGGLILVIVGLGFALCSLFLKQILISTGGDPTPIISMGIGFYVWLASFVVCIVGYIFTITTDALSAKKNGAV